MFRSILLNILNSLLFLLLFTTAVFAQLTDVIPSSSFYKPTSVPISRRPTVVPLPSLTVTTFQLENNVLGIQQRNPAINPAAESTDRSNLVVNILGLFFLGIGGIWFYKNRKDILTSIKNSG